MVVEFSILPLGAGASLRHVVARAVDIVERSGLEYQVTAMGTLLEGTWDQVFAVIQKCHQAASEQADRVMTRIVVDDRKGFSGQIRGKVDDVEAVLGRPVRR